MTIKQLGSSSIRLPAIGQGIGEYSWGEDQIVILRKGVDLGMNFLDTAERYDNGRSEQIIGKVVKGIRKNVIIATKFSPEHSTYNEVLKAAEGSLCRLNTDYIDLYQMHWPNPKVLLEETLSAMERLVKEGKVRYIGIGNVYSGELSNAARLLTTEKIASLQAEYNLFDRTIEDEVMPFCEKNNIIIIAYTPLDRGRLADGERQREVLKEIADKYHKTSAQIVLRWLTSKPCVVAIPKATNIKHLGENAASTDFDLEKGDAERIGSLFKKTRIYVPPDKIRVSPHGEGKKAVYQTLQEAKENRLKYTPSPLDLVESIKKEEFIKPVRLVRINDTGSRYEYDLIEGRIRYWAWVIARGNIPVPAYIREDWPQRSNNRKGN